MNKYIIEESVRKKLGSYIREIRESKKIGLNQLAVKIDVVNSLVSKLENGITQKISPFLLKEIALGLNINYKDLYKIVGFLDENDFKEAELLRNQIEEYQEKYATNNHNNGSQIIGSTISGNIDNRSNVLVDLTRNKLDIIDVETISKLFDLNEEKSKELIKYLKYLKSE
ncbi:MAG: helix-turn-helix domain-containing protein [Fusobacteriaceae bacterium]